MALAPATLPPSPASIPDPEDENRVMGTLVVDRAAPSFEHGVAHVWIETAAPADAPAKRLAQTQVPDIRHRAGDAEEIPFDFASYHQPRDGGARLRAWVDIDGHGPAARGDLFSTEAVPVSAGPCVVRVEDPAAGYEQGET